MKLDHQGRIGIILASWLLFVTPIAVLFESVGASIAWLVITSIILFVLLWSVTPEQGEIPTSETMYTASGIAILGLIITLVMSPSDVDEPEFVEDDKTVTLNLDGQSTTYKKETTHTYEIKEDRVSEISYWWVKKVVEEVCYPEIKKDLKEGLEKFGYYHIETNNLIHKKCDAQEELKKEIVLNEKDKELMELVN